MSKDNNHDEHILDGIRCNVANCHYNMQGKLCTAKGIRVGPQYANTSSDTVCDTFKPGQSMY